jgi:hypothetical protein
MSRPPANPPFGQAPAGEAVATLIPRGSTSTVGIPAGGAASIRAAIPPGRHQRKSASTTPAAGTARPMEAGGHTPATHLPSCLALSRR